jgi:hypothetical protein
MEACAPGEKRQHTPHITNHTHTNIHPTCLGDVGRLDGALADFGRPLLKVTGPLLLGGRQRALPLAHGLPGFGLPWIDAMDGLIWGPNWNRMDGYFAGLDTPHTLLGQINHRSQQVEHDNDTHARRRCNTHIPGAGAIRWTYTHRHATTTIPSQSIHPSTIIQIAAQSRGGGDDPRSLAPRPTFSRAVPRRRSSPLVRSSLPTCFDTQFQPNEDPPLLLVQPYSKRGWGAHVLVLFTPISTHRAQDARAGGSGRDSCGGATTHRGEAAQVSSCRQAFGTEGWSSSPLLLLRSTSSSHTH